MDILSLGKANKAKRAIKKVNARLGTGIASTYDTTAKRLDFLESKDPKVSPSARISALEANTHINLNKHNLRVEALMNKGRLNLKESVVDDLEDATGLELASSVNVTHDTANHLVKATNATLDATLLFKKEILSLPATMITTSLVYSGSEKPSIEIKENDGTWTPLKVDDLNFAKTGKEWTSIELRAKLKNDQQLNAIAYSWN